MFDFWQNNTCVTSVNLEDNRIGNEGAKAIADMLGVGSQHLGTTRQPLLSNPHLHNIFHAFRVELAPPANRVFSFDFRQKNTSVQILNLGDNKIGNEGATVIAKVLEVGSQPILSPIRLLLSYPGLHIVSYAFRASLAAANSIHFFDILN